MGCCASSSPPPQRLCKPAPSAPRVLIDSYTLIEGTLFEDVLKQGCISVVKGSYFEACLEQEKPFQDRASIPVDYIYSGEEAAALWKQYGNCFLIILSYSWLSEKHPDPKLFHLKRLVPFLKELRQQFDKATGLRQELGIIIDFCSLFQNMCKEDSGESRTAEQLQAFQKGLKAINTPYAHRDVTAIKLTGTPEDEKRTYDSRGWTLFESRVIDCKGTGMLAQSKGYKMPRTPTNPGAWNVFVLDALNCSEYDDLRSGRQPPCNSSRFCEELAQRQKLADKNNVRLFTNGKDHPFVTKKYEETYQKFLQTEMYNFASMAVSDSYMSAFSIVLNDFKSLTEINLADNQIGAEGAVALAKALQTNTSIATMSLADNQIGAEGAAALAKALQTNMSIATMSLAGNGIGAEGAAALAKALETNTSIATMSLQFNGIGDEGAAALAKALETNTSIATMSLQTNGIGDEGAAALAKALETNTSIATMDLTFNQIGAEGAAALAKALETNTSIATMNLAYSIQLTETNLVDWR